MSRRPARNQYGKTRQIVAYVLRATRSVSGSEKRGTQAIVKQAGKQSIVIVGLAEPPAPRISNRKPARRKASKGSVRPLPSPYLLDSPTLRPVTSVPLSFSSTYYFYLSNLTGVGVASNRPLQLAQHKQ
ncbi:hypothetical protein MRB53_036335 [Persea americana]|nr:hypothetical protein MRB53_036406 [Persea americana]KAJ8614922.1 hypothetical protein MRB53_036335 [Persea americana]